MAWGTPGGDAQDQVNLQFFLNVVEFGMDIQSALDARSFRSSIFRRLLPPRYPAGNHAGRDPHERRRHPRASKRWATRYARSGSGRSVTLPPSASTPAAASSSEPRGPAGTSLTRWPGNARGPAALLRRLPPHRVHERPIGGVRPKRRFAPTSSRRPAFPLKIPLPERAARVQCDNFPPGVFRRRPNDLGEVQRERPAHFR